MDIFRIIIMEYFGFDSDRNYNWRLHHQNKHVKRRIIKINCRSGSTRMLRDGSLIHEPNKYFLYLGSYYGEYRYRTKHKESHGGHYSYHDRYKTWRAKYKQQTYRELTKNYEQRT